jgi:hypothetical protein
LPSLSNTLCFGVKRIFFFRVLRKQRRKRYTGNCPSPKANPTGGIWSFIPLAIIFTDQSKVAVNAKELLLYDSSFFLLMCFESNKIVYFGILQ